MPIDCNSRRRARLTFVVALLATSIATADDAAPSVSIADVVKAWEARSGRVRTLRFKWNDRYTVSPGAYDGLPKKTTTYDLSFSLGADGDRIRFEKNHITRSLDGQIVPIENLWIWSPDEFKKLMRSGGVPYPRGSVIKTNHISDPPGNELDVRPLLLMYRPFHLSWSALGNFTKRYRVLSGNHTVDGRRCILLRSEPRSSEHITTSLYVDPMRDFVVMRMTCEAAGVESIRVTFLEYRQSDGEWVPIRWATKSPGSNSDSQVADFALNASLPANEFELEFPLGAWVKEHENPETYIVKEGGKRRPITRKELRRHGTYEDFLTSETGTLAPGPDATDLDAARREILASTRYQQVLALKVCALSKIPVIKDDEVDVHVGPVGVFDTIEPIQVAVDDESCNQLLFGKGRNEAQARSQITTRLQSNISEVDRICGLNDAQKQKLDLAGRGDIARWCKRVEELRLKIQEPYNEEAVQKGALDPCVMKLREKTTPLRRAVACESFESDSLFAKTLKKVLTAEQSARYEAARSKPAGVPKKPDTQASEKP